MTRDPQHFSEAEQEASEPTDAQEAFLLWRLREPITEARMRWGRFVALTSDKFIGAELKFRDGSTLHYDRETHEWEAQPAVMTPKAFHLRMKRIHRRNRDDHEVTHGGADKLMEDLLISLGYEAGIKYLRKQTCWYA